MFDKYIEYAERFESLFLGTKSNPNLIKNQIPGLLALYILPRIFFLLVHHIIKIEEKKSCNIYGQKLAKDIYLLSTYIKAFLLFIELIIKYDAYQYDNLLKTFLHKIHRR